ncbi:MAG: hypothetical protein Q7V40_19970, partial [Pseudolabrys sp.]|nr:hypothetical protein [Pseudolabrys sp.]
CVVGPDAEPKYKLSLELIIAIKPIPAFCRQPASRVFSAMASQVEDVLVATEAKTAALLLSKKES